MTRGGGARQSPAIITTTRASERSATTVTVYSLHAMNMSFTHTVIIIAAGPCASRSVPTASPGS